MGGKPIMYLGKKEDDGEEVKVERKYHWALL